MAELVYSSRDVKYHGGIIKDKNGKFIRRVAPFEISEKVLDGDKVVFKTRKVIIRNNKTKVIEELNIPLKNTNTENKSLVALSKLMSIFNEDIKHKKEVIIN